MRHRSFNRQRLSTWVCTSVTATLAGSACAGDFNGDGFDDLAVGVPYEEIGVVVDAGCVNVIYGAPPGLIASGGGGAIVPGQLWHQNSVGIADVAQADDRFGFSLASGDLNGDGFDELVIGAPGEMVGAVASAGCIHVLYGSPVGLTSVGSLLITQAFLGDPVEIGDGFGYAIAVGDINGDGEDDILVSAPFENAIVPDDGMAHVLYGLPGGGVVPGGLPIMIQGMGGFGDPSEFQDNFGLSLALGNFNADPFMDAVFGVPNEDVGAMVNAGMIHVVPGSPAGLMPGTGPTPFIIQSMLPIGDPTEADDRFGFSLAAGDIDGDGDDDLVVGAPTEDVGAMDAGALDVIAGVAGVGLPPATAVFIPQGAFGIDVSELNDNFGYSVALADFNGDGFADIVAGRPYENAGAIVDAGEATIIPGSPAGPGLGPPSSEWSQSTAGVLDVCETSDFFSISVAAGDFNGNGFDDLSIGVSGEDVGTSAPGVDAGECNVLYGTPLGITAAGDQVWHQNSAGVPGAIEVGDGFGRSLGIR